jgi:hypothetical protein
MAHLLTNAVERAEPTVGEQGLSLKHPEVCHAVLKLAEEEVRERLAETSVGAIQVERLADQAVSSGVVHPLAVIGAALWVAEVIPRRHLHDVRREPLDMMTTDLDYGMEEVRREGFADHPAYRWPSEWVRMFCASHKGCMPHSVVTRIEFAYT